MPSGELGERDHVLLLYAGKLLCEEKPSHTSVFDVGLATMIVPHDDA